MFPCATLKRAVFAVFLLHCGSRTDISDVLSAGPLPDASPPLDAKPAMDVVSPLDVIAPVDVTPPPLDAPVDVGPPPPPCVPAPAGGVTIAMFPGPVLYMGLAVANGSVFTATDSSQYPSSPLDLGAIAETPALGGASRSLASPSYTLGNVVTDGARLYYEQTSGMAEGSSSAIYSDVGAAAIDLATGSVTTIATAFPPWPASSVPTSTMIAATTAKPGVFWIGGDGNVGDTLSEWTPESGVATAIYTGQSLSGVAADASGVYWADVGDGISTVINHLPLDGSADPHLTVTKAPGRHGVLLGVSSADVVFVGDEQMGDILAAPKTGGTPRLVAKAAAAWVNDLAWVDDPYVYWVENATPNVLTRVSLSGGTPEVVPTTGSVQWLAFDACNVYVASTNPAVLFAMQK